MFLEAGKQTDRRVFHLQSLIEGALHREAGDMEMSQTVSCILCTQFIYCCVPGKWGLQRKPPPKRTDQTDQPFSQ